MLDALYAEPELPKNSLRIAERDAIIRERYAAGASQAQLARKFGISYQRVHQILSGG